MKKIFILLFAPLLLMSCDSSISLIDTVKQTVIPGRPNLKEFNNYVVEFSYGKEATVTIDSIQVYEGKKVYLTEFTLQKKGSGKYLDRLSEKGTYTIEVPLQDKNILRTTDQEREQEKLMIYYRENDVPKELVVSEFETERVTRR